MKRALLTLAAAASLSAQAQIHGVGGYYNWTPTQIQADDLFTLDTNGKKMAGFYPEVSYTDDMEYCCLTLGVNNTEFDETKGGYQHRAGFKISDDQDGTGALTLTRDYPVLVLKMSVPMPDDETSSVGITGSYFEPEFLWYNPSTGSREAISMSGFSNGRVRFLKYGGNALDSLGRDSVQLANASSDATNWGYERARVDAIIHKSKVDTVFYSKRLDPEANETAEFLIAIDFSKIGSYDSETGVGTSCLDTCDIVMQQICLSFIGSYSDVYNADGTERTLLERPTAYLKWIKTFPSMGDYTATLCAEENWGDGANPENPMKLVMQGSMYQIEQLMAQYPLSDQLTILTKALASAQECYDDDEAETEDFAAMVTELASAKANFLAAIVYPAETKNNNIISYTGMYLGLSAAEVENDGFTGRQIISATKTTATSFLFADAGEVNGQQAWTLTTNEGTAIQTSDGSLLIVDATQLATTTAAKVVMSNRGSDEEMAYDMKVGSYYYYIDQTTGVLTYAESFPSYTDLYDVDNYLFIPEEALYDTSDHDDVNYPMTQGEGSWSEFNDGAVMGLDAAYEYCMANNDWSSYNAETIAAVQARATYAFMDGWCKNGYRMNNNVESATAESGESCMRINVMATYDDIKSDSSNVCEATTDYTSTTSSISVMREHGPKYNKCTDKAPANNQTCDSLYAVNLNSGINRYFAMKFKANTDQIQLSQMVFFVLKNVREPAANLDNLLEQRGDVYIWDLMEVGVPTGDNIACAQYLQFTGAQCEEDAVYVDWLRFYDTLDDIPTEEMTVAASTAIAGVSSTRANTIYTLSGLRVSQATAPGVYIINGKKILK